MFKIRNFILVLLLFFVFFLVTSNVAKGQTSVTPTTKVTVNYVAGKIEKIGEKMTLFFKRGKISKTNYYEYLSEKRLAELLYVVENNQINSVEETASRYSTYIGTLTNYVVANKISEKKDEIIKMFNEHSLIISELQKKFKYDSAWWLVTQHDINTISLLSIKIKGL